MIFKVQNNDASNFQYLYYGFLCWFGHLPLSQYGPRNMAKAYVAKLAHLCWHCHGPDQAKCLQSTREGPNLKFKCQ